MPSGGCRDLKDDPGRGARTQRLGRGKFIFIIVCAISMTSCYEHRGACRWHCVVRFSFFSHRMGNVSDDDVFCSSQESAGRSSRGWTSGGGTGASGGSSSTPASSSRIRMFQKMLWKMIWNPWSRSWRPSSTAASTRTRFPIRNLSAGYVYFNHHTGNSTDVRLLFVLTGS